MKSPELAPFTHEKLAWRVIEILVLQDVHPEESCSFGEIFAQSVSNLSALYHVKLIGYRLRGSGQRAYSIDANTSREMDWQISDVGLPTTPISLGSTLKLSLQIKGTEYIRSFGRSRGLQIGQISNTTSLIFHEGYVAKEWCVIKCPEAPAEQLEEGGIGIEGDSGALIVDKSNELVSGMLQKRQGHGGSKITLFTPMSNIFDDIHRRTGVREIALIPGQTMARISERRHLYDTETIDAMTAMFKEEQINLVSNIQRKALDTYSGLATELATRLASVLAQNRKFAKAEKLYFQTFESWDKLLESTAFKTLQYKHGLAEVLWQVGKYMEAFQMAVQGLKLASNACNEFGSERFKLLRLSYRSLMTNISLSVFPGMFIGQCVELMAPRILELVEGRLEILGPDHPYTLHSAYLLRRTYSKDRQEEAQKVLESLFKKYADKESFGMED